MNTAFTTSIQSYSLFRNMLRLSIFFGFCALASNAAYTYEEYYKRQAIVDEMDSLYERYLNTDSDDINERKSIEMKLLRFCDTKFDEEFVNQMNAISGAHFVQYATNADVHTRLCKNSHVWIMKALKDPKGNLVEGQLMLNKFNLAKTEMFVKTAFETAERASRIGLWCSAMKRNQQRVGRLSEFQTSSDTEMPELMEELNAQTESDLRENVTALVEEWVANTTFGYDNQTQQFMQEAAATLRKDFPVGQWITVAFPEWEYHKICHRNGTFFVSKSAKWMWLFKVFLLRDGQKYDIQAAEDALNGIKDKRVEDFCRDEMKPIMKEANYTCNSDQFTFFGVLGNAVFGASDEHLFLERDITRHGPYDTKCRFKVAILV